MRRAIRLRRWQKAAFDAFVTADRPDYLAVATPGAGKTTFALAAALADLAEAPQRRVVVVAPTQHLKRQWASAAAAFGLALESEWRSAEPLPRDLHGVVVTYQQVAASAAALATLTRDAFVILDEIHHAGADRAWGEALAEAAAPAARRLALSGTPFRSDDLAIPFVRYHHDEAVPDFTYGYGEALAEGGVVRRIYFPRLDGEMEWTAPDGTHRAATFTDPLDRARANQRLRTALSPGGDWLPDALKRGHEQLTAIRRDHPHAGGLVVAMDTEHARDIARLLRERVGVAATVATSDEADASQRIARFAEADDEWLVAVRMVSEGVDIPRLRVGVFATNTMTELFFRQAVGRFVRWTPGIPRQASYLFVPDDPRLRTYAAEIGADRRHHLRPPAEPDDAVREPAEPAAAGGDEQLSLFAAIAARPVDEDAPLPLLGDDDPDPEPGALDDPGLELSLAAPPLPGGTDGAELPRPARRRELRARNAERAKLIVGLSGLTHSQVNAELNRRAGLRSIREATLEQLAARLEAADQWVRRM